MSVPMSTSLGTGESSILINAVCMFDKLRINISKSKISIASFVGDVVR